MDGWMDLLVGTGVSTALENVQWPKPFLTPAKPLRSGWLIQRIDSSTATTTGATLPYLQYFDSRSRQTAVGPDKRKTRVAEVGCTTGTADAWEQWI